MTKYYVQLSGDGIVSATAYVEANTEEEAKEKALAKADGLHWELSSLHEDPYVQDIEIDEKEKS